MKYENIKGGDVWYYKIKIELHEVNNHTQNQSIIINKINQHSRTHSNARSLVALNILSLSLCLNVDEARERREDPEKKKDTFSS
jgi:hypothetical protein